MREKFSPSLFQKAGGVWGNAPHKQTDKSKFELDRGKTFLVCRGKILSKKSKFYQINKKDHPFSCNIPKRSIL